jgi:hypothetical protein
VDEAGAKPIRLETPKTQALLAKLRVENCLVFIALLRAKSEEPGACVKSAAS